MLECQTCQDRLIEFAFGLLDEPQAAEVSAHVAGCASCQSALEAVQAEKNLLARAARAVRVVPEFKVPDESIPAQPATLPMDQPAAPQKRSIWRRPIVGWAIAAAILIAITVPIAGYRMALDRDERELAALRNAHKETEHLLAVLPAAQAAKHNNAIDKIHAEAAPHLQVIGPTSLQPGAKGNLHITTRHPEGNAIPANVRVKLTDAASGDVIRVTRLQTDGTGHARAEVDAAAARPGSKLNLTVEADIGFASSSIKESVRVETPSYVTRIDTSKNIYQLKDVLFCRVLVLDRHTLQPPPEPIPLHIELAHGKNVVRSLDQATGPGGILAAEFAVEEKFAEGDYALSVRGVDPGRQVQAMTAHVEIVRALPGIRLDPNPYFAGGTLTGELVLRDGAPPMPKQVQGTINGKPVPVTLQPQAQPNVQAFGGAASRTTADKGKSAANKKDADKMEAATGQAPGQVYRFQAPVPKDLPKEAKSLQLAVQVPGEAAKGQPLRASAPLTPTEYEVDFYPEGGDLIAGVPNRVYFRVRAKGGEPITGDGRLILWVKGKDNSLQILADETYRLGLGQFEFTPSMKDSYTVRITTPNATSEIANPFAKLGGIRGAGVVLHVARAVGKQNEPIRMTIRRQGPPRKLLLVAQCRGQIVDERWVEDSDPILKPTADARGMIRITAFEVDGVDAVPVAERLVYRASAQRLDLKFTLKTRDFDAGSKTSAKITARDETGQPAAGWVLASVVDERFQAKPPSLSAHFLLINEIRGGADLDQAQIILNDGPESAEMLERFLGTHGWRRFVARKAGAKIEANAQGAPLLFSRENQPMAAVQKQYEARIAAAVAPIQQEAIRSEIGLKNERDRLSTAAALAAAQLADFEARIQLGVRLALGGLMAILLAASVGLMAVGGYRVLRGRRSPTWALGGAFACLIFCLGTLLAGQFLLAPAENPRNPGAAPVHARAHVNLEKMLGDQLPKVRHVAGKTPTGTIVLRGGEQAERQLRDGAAADFMGQLEELHAESKALDQLRRAPLLAHADRSVEQNQMLMKRFQSAAAGMSAKKKEGAPIPAQAPAGQKEPAPAPAGGAGGGGVIGGAMNIAPPRGAAVQREFAHVHTPGLSADTLLWHPMLWLENGAADIHFDVGSGQATYRVLLLGHDAHGRLGCFETRLDATGTSR